MTVVFFDGFEIEGCLWWNEIYIPDLDNTDTSKLHVVMPGFISDNNSEDSIIGYYYSAALGSIDSILITEDNYTDYYVWVITSDNECSVLAPLAPDEDGICEPWIGEDYTNCADCPIPLFNERDLFLWEAQPRTDWKNDGSWPRIRYQESWLSGDYEIDFQYMTIGNGAGHDIKSQRTWLWNPLSVGSNGLPKTLFLPGNSEEIINYDYPNSKLIAKIKANGRNRELEKCRKKWPFGGTKCEGTNDPIEIKKVLSRNFHPGNDALLYLLQELDKMGNIRETTIPYFRGYLRNFGLLHSKKRKPYTSETQTPQNIGNLIGQVNLIDCDPITPGGFPSQWTQYPTTLVNPLTGMHQDAWYIDDNTDNEFRLRFVFFGK